MTLIIFLAHHSTKNFSLIPLKFCGLLSIPLQGFNRLVQSCPIHYCCNPCELHHGRCCLLISKQCTCGLVYPRNSSDFLGRIYFLVFCLLNLISTGGGGCFHPPICFLPVTFLLLSQFPPNLVTFPKI